MRVLIADVARRLNVAPTEQAVRARLASDAGVGDAEFDAYEESSFPEVCAGGQSFSLLRAEAGSGQSMRDAVLATRPQALRY